MYYLIGIKGAGMSSLAEILYDLGNKVVGYDDNREHTFTEDPLIKRGIEIYSDQTYPLKKEDTVVYSPAFRSDHRELVRANELGLKIILYNEMIGELTKKLFTISISGCHGKTTTTSMLSHVLDNISGASYLIGDGTGKVNPDNKYFVLEACEYRRHFLYYTSKYSIITNVELDHVDYYKDIEDVKSAYEEFANKTENMVVACGDDEYTRKLKITKPVLYYGTNENNDIIAKNVKLSNDGTSFDVYVKDKFYGHFDLPLYGRHMLLNSLAVIGICYIENLNAVEVASHLKTFKGAKRRFKEKVIGDIVTIDDYAHHPTEVKVTILGARQKYPNKEIIAVLMIHTYTRARRFETEFIDALNLADSAYVMDVYMDRKEDVKPYDVHEMISKLKNGDHISIDDPDKLLKHKNAVILFMSSKEIYRLQEPYEKRLTEK